MSNPDFVAPDYTTQDAATYKANIDSSIAANGSDYINLGCSYSAGTFTIHDAGGTALSATNPAFVKFQDAATPGYVKYISVEANQAFIDDAGSSEIINNLFGATTGVAWGNDCPFYIYAVANDDMDTVQFMLSRVPHRTTAPAVGEIGAPDDAVADNEYSFWSFDNIDETAYDGNPCVCVGSIRMQMSASDDWTVQALATTDGIGMFNTETRFSVPTGQKGAASGTVVVSNAGTEPVFTTHNYDYTINREGVCNIYMYLATVSTPGVGTNPVVFIWPLEPEDTNDLRGQTGGYNNGSDGILDIVCDPTTTGLRFYDHWGLIGTAHQRLDNQDFDTNDDLWFSAWYRLKDS